MELISNRQPSSSGRQSLQLTSRQSSAARAIEARYGDARNFLLTFNPSSQRAHAALDCVGGTAATPRLVEVRWTYGDALAETWLEAQLYDLNEYAGQREKMTPGQIEQTAQVLIDTYGYLTVGEVMLFFRRFKAGRYGHFWGSIDPLTITSAFADFMDERRVELQRIEAELERERQEREAAASKAVSLREYCRMKGLPETDNIIDAIFQDKPNKKTTDDK